MPASGGTEATQVQLPTNVWEHENGINRTPDFSRKIGNSYFYVKCPIDSIQKKIRVWAKQNWSVDWIHYTGYQFETYDMVAMSEINSKEVGGGSQEITGLWRQ